MLDRSKGSLLLGAVAALLLLFSVLIPMIRLSPALAIEPGNTDEAVAFIGYDGFDYSNQACSSADGVTFGCEDLEMPNAYGEYVFTTGVAVGDLDEDGHVDAVFATSYGDEYQVCLADGLGSYDCSGMGPTSSAPYATGVKLGYVNGDGYLDAVFSTGGGGNVSVCLGDGKGGFTCSESGSVAYANGIDLGDINGDGFLDVVLAGQEANAVCLGDGSGGFSCVDFPGNHRNSKDVALGDFDSDGNLDAVFANWDSVGDADVILNELDQVCFGDGVGGFTCEPVGPAEYYLSEGVEVADLDGDGDLDLVIATQWEDRACLGDGAGAFVCSSIGTANLAWDVAVADVDSDGDIDALFVGYSEDRKCLNDGSGGFTCSVLAPATNGGRAVAAWAPKPLPPPADSFNDDDGSIFESDIEWMAAAGITKGCNPPTNDRFCPDSVVTRGQMAAFLVRALGLTDRLVDPFTDDDGSVFEADIERLAAAGITRGCNPPTNDRFCPDGKVTREQMAAFLVRALGYTDAGAGDLFVDDDSSIFEGDIDRLATAGVTKGCNPPTNDRFCPSGFVTRGQMAAFLHRALS